MKCHWWNDQNEYFDIAVIRTMVWASKPRSLNSFRKHCALKVDRNERLELLEHPFFSPYAALTSSLSSAMYWLVLFAAYSNSYVITTTLIAALLMSSFILFFIG